MISVRISATSANIGPGFDSLGIALNLYTTIHFSESNELIFEGCDEAYANEENLIYTSFIHTLALCGVTIKGVKIKIESDIPSSRGLGSSAACIVGGVLGANAYCDHQLSEQEVFLQCVRLEGHPDNITPALYGSLCASFMDEGEVHKIKFDPHPNLKFVAFIPDFELSTVESRKVLPKEVKFEDAIFNISRSVALCKALETYDRSIIKASLNDRLHQPYRSTLIHEFNEVKTICEKNQCLGFYLSGAGPTLMSIVENDKFVYDIEEEINKLHRKWRVVPLQIDYDGAVILEDKTWKNT